MFGASTATKEVVGAFLRGCPLRGFMVWELVKLGIRCLWVIFQIPYKTKGFKGTLLMESVRQEFIIDQFKPLILEIGLLLADVVPDPASDVLLRYRNSEALIKLRDEYFKHERLEWERAMAIRGLFNLGIIIVDRNNCYMKRASWIRREWGAMDWEEEMPTKDWEE